MHVLIIYNTDNTVTKFGHDKTTTVIPTIKFVNKSIQNLLSHIKRFFRDLLSVII